MSLAWQTPSGTGTLITRRYRVATSYLTSKLIAAMLIAWGFLSIVVSLPVSARARLLSVWHSGAARANCSGRVVWVVCLRAGLPGVNTLDPGDTDDDGATGGKQSRRSDKCQLSGAFSQRRVGRG